MFGSKCYIKIDEENLGKFDARSNEGIFLGYSIKIKFYRCYNKRLRKIVESANVKVDENLHNFIPLDGYVSDEPDCTKLEGIIDEQEVHNEEEDALEKTPKTPKYVQTNHSKGHNIGDKRKGVLTRRKAIQVEVKFYLLSKFELKLVRESCKDELN